MKTLREMIDLVESAQNGDYEYPYTMSARDKGRYDAMQGREYRNPYSPFGTESDHNNSIEYSAAYDSVGEKGVAEADETSWTANSAKFGAGYDDFPVAPQVVKFFTQKLLKAGYSAEEISKLPDMEIARLYRKLDETRDEELDRKFNSPEQLKKDADYRAYRAGVKQSRKEQPKPLEEETQEYTVRVVDEEGSGYTVKVQAASEQQALHKAIVKVRNQYDAYPEHARIIRQGIEEASPEAVHKINSLFKDE